jgi:signal transduction histidine kinase
LHDAVERELGCLVTLGSAAGTVAHQINNPLGTIHNAFLLVKDAIPPTHPHFRCVGAIESNIQRIADVTRRFIETYDPARDSALDVSVSAIVSGLGRFVSKAAGLTAGRLVVDNRVHDPFPEPAGLLRHALQPLLETALLYAPAEEAVTLRVTLAVALLRIVIDSPGVLLPPSVDLAYSRRLASSMGGQLEEHAPELFILTVPMHATHEGMA